MLYYIISYYIILYYIILYYIILYYIILYYILHIVYYIILLYYIILYYIILYYIILYYIILYYIILYIKQKTTLTIGLHIHNMSTSRLLSLFDSNRGLAQINDLIEIRFMFDYVSACVGYSFTRVLNHCHDVSLFGIIKMTYISIWQVMLNNCIYIHFSSVTLNLSLTFYFFMFFNLFV